MAVTRRSSGGGNNEPNTNTDVVLASDDTATILDKLNKEIEKLKEIETTPWKTSGNVDGFSTNIKEEKQIPNLIRMYSSVKAREENYDDAAEDLGLTTYPAFDINGSNAEAFRADIQLRLAIIQQKDRLDKLRGFKEKMSKFLTEAEQKASVLKDLQNFLNS